MFAYCNYVDDQNRGTGNTFGSWQTLKCIDINACANRWTEDTSFLSNFSSAKKLGKYMQYDESGIFKCRNFQTI